MGLKGYHPHDMTLGRKLWQVRWLFVLLLGATAGIGAAALAGEPQLHDESGARDEGGGADPEPAPPARGPTTPPTAGPTTR